MWVSKLEAAQAVVYILEWRTENRAVIDKFTGKSIPIWGIDIGVLPHGWMTLGEVLIGKFQPPVFWSNDVPKCYKELSARGVEFLGPPKTEARGTSSATSTAINFCGHPNRLYLEVFMPAAATLKRIKKSPYSMHPAFDYEEAGLRLIQERTGKTLEEWIAHVRKNGPEDPKDRLAWLKKQGLTMNYACWVGSRASGTGGRENYDPEKLVDALFAGPKAALRPIYEKLLNLGLSIAKDVKACPCSTIVPLYRNHVFAQIKPSTNTRIDMGFALGGMKSPGKLIDTGGYAKNDRITHRLPITALAEIDDELMKWLKKAYELDA